MYWAVLGIIMIGKTIAAMALVLFFRYPINTALTVGASLAQIGEFSFILAALGVSLNLLSLDGQNLILAGALISITLNSFIFSAVEPVQNGFANVRLSRVYWSVVVIRLPCYRMKSRRTICAIRW